MIFLFLLCLTRVESAVDFDSGGVLKVTELNVRRIPKFLARAEPNTRFNEPSDHRFQAESILSQVGQPYNRDGSESIQVLPLRRCAQELFDSEWVHPPISKYLTTVVMPGMVVNYGKVADLGRLSLTAATRQSVDGVYHTNLTILHENLKITYKYNLDGPKGRLEVNAPSRTYSIHLYSKEEGLHSFTKISDMALEEEDELEFSAHGESSDNVTPYIKFLEHVLTSESRRTAFFNIQAAVNKKLQTLQPLFCQDFQ